MKTKVFFLLMVLLTFSLEAFSTDPRTQQYMSGTSNIIGAAQSVAWAQSNSAACGACVGMCWACVWVGTGYTGALANAATATQNFIDAGKLSTTGNVSLSPETQQCLDDPMHCTDPGVPVDNNTSSTQSTPEDLKKLSDTATNILNIAQQGLDDLKASGHMPADLNDPALADKLPPMTPEQKAALQDYENKKSKLDAMSTQEKVDMLLSGEYGDYSAAGTRTISGSSEIEMDSFDPNSLLAMLQNQGMENSAPGYYGNVPLQVLNPHSKLSLFQRVSLKMKNFK